MKTSNINLAALDDLFCVITNADEVGMGDHIDLADSSACLGVMDRDEAALLIESVHEEGDPDPSNPPPRFDMRCFLANLDCGTAYCIAGFAALLSVAEKGPPSSTANIEGVGRRYLGLSQECGTALFTPNHLADDISLLEITRSHALSVLGDIHLHARTSDTLTPNDILAFWRKAMALPGVGL